jgi:hypothetical protein
MAGSFYVLGFVKREVFEQNSHTDVFDSFCLLVLAFSDSNLMETVI